MTVQSHIPDIFIPSIGGGKSLVYNNLINDKGALPKEAVRHNCFIMKKAILIITMCLMALTAHAQKCAVLDFQLGTNVTAEEVDAISYNFRTNFYPDNYNVIDIERVNNLIKTLGYDKTGMTKQELLKVGRKLEAKILVVGTLNKLMDEYSVDVQVIDVSTGTTVASEGNTFQKSEYRREVKYIAQSLVHKIE